MNKFIYTLILVSSSVFAVGEDGSSGEPSTNKAFEKICYYLNVGEDGSSGISSVGEDGSSGISSVGEDGSSGIDGFMTTGNIVCQLKQIRE